MRIFTSPLSILFILVLSLNGFLRLGFYFKACREEQFACDVSNFLQPLASLAGEAASNRNLRYFFSISSLILVPLIMRQFLKHHGNLNGTSPAVMCAHYVPILSAICVALHWALQAAPPAVLNTLATWQVGSFFSLHKLTCINLTQVFHSIQLLTRPLKQKKNKLPSYYDSRINYGRSD